MWLAGDLTTRDISRFYSLLVEDNNTPSTQTTVVIYADLSVSVVWVISTGNLGSVMVSMLVRNGKWPPFEILL